MNNIFKKAKRAKLMKGSPVDVSSQEHEGKEESSSAPQSKLEVNEQGDIMGEAKHAPAPAVKEKKAVKSGKSGSVKLTQKESRLKKKDDISEDFELLKRQLEERVGLNKSFDVVFREMVFGGQKTGIFYYNGFAKDQVLTDIITRLSYAVEVGSKEDGNKQGESDGGGERDQKPSMSIVELFDKALIPHIQVQKTDCMKTAVDNVAAGGTAFFFEGQKEALLVDAKSFPARSTEEPDLERVVRGSRDGFVETLLTNVTLVRRRLRDPRLKLEMMRAGQRTQTDICLAYIEDICDERLVESVKDKINQVNVDGLPLGEKQLEEAIVGKGWNPYPMVRYSERPDVVTAHLLEGHMIVFVDTSPSVMILPTTFFHHVQHAEEYRQTPTIGTYLRWVRFLGIMASLFLLPLWYLLVTSPELKPAGLEFLGPAEEAKLPMLLQFFIAELGIDLMRMAAVHTPTPLATAMGLVAAILIGDVAVKTGLFVNEVILYLAVAAIGTFATPSYELSLANRLMRLGLLVSAAMFKVPGLVVASTGLVLLLALQRSYNTPYMWPFLPFNAKALYDIMIRRPFTSMKKRMSLTKTLDSSRQSQS
ncbi:spore germination protein [Paenibacillus sp. YYML68]|uniref:spore germination protein n=1 Tax=Paenibacillus sp. YYML68 TaxID=2909250 RepID=UPI002492BDAD|nr:spore germination protein [Paenibacillus sp. YYML68]